MIKNYDVKLIVESKKFSNKNSKKLFRFGKSTMILKSSINIQKKVGKLTG